METSYITIALLAYFIGSIPFGLVITTLAGLGDVRSIGSGNIGATNVMRTGHKGLAILTLLLDLGKGMLAIYVAWRMQPEAMYIAGYFAVIGHIYPIWLKFKGGKGVATYLGTLLALHILLGFVFIVAWLLTFLFSRISSLSSLTACLAVVVASVFSHNATLLIFTCVLGGFIFFKHSANIIRLFHGIEPKFNKNP